jgi:hypothetical protein
VGHPAVLIGLTAANLSLLSPVLSRAAAAGCPILCAPYDILTSRLIAVRNGWAAGAPISSRHRQDERLDKLSEPKLNFPAKYMKPAPNFSNADATVNGIESTLMPFAPKDLEDHY